MLIPIKFIFYVGLLIFSFFSGVKYADQAKGSANWLFEAKEQEIEYKEIEKDLKNNKDAVTSEPIAAEEIEHDIILEDDIISEEDIIEDDITTDETLDDK